MMLMWQQNLMNKFQEKFPGYFKGCTDGTWHFMKSSNMCAVKNREIGAVCVFTYKNEKDFSLTIGGKQDGKK